MPHGVTNGRHGTGLTSLTITWLRQSCDSKAFQEVEEHIGATRVQNMALREVLCRPRTGGAVTSHNLSLSHVLFSLFLALSLSLSLCFLSISLHRAITTVLPIAWPAYLRHIGKHRLEAQLTILQHPSYLYFLQCCLQIPEYGMQKSLYSAKSWKFTAYKRREKKTVVTVGCPHLYVLQYIYTHIYIYIYIHVIYR